MIGYFEGKTPRQEKEAKEIWETLAFAYPGHPWWVSVYDRGFFIRHMEFPRNWGMNHRSGKATYSASALKRQIILMAGEWLERAHLRRGAADGTEITQVEGLAQKYQPGQSIILKGH